MSSHTEEQPMDVMRTYEYGGTVLQLAAYEAVTPRFVKPSFVRAPGAGSFVIEQLKVTEDDQGLRLAAKVGGKNIAYLYAEILLKDEDLDRFYGPVAREFVRAEREQDIGGARRPIWDDPVAVQVGVRPSLRLLTDGVDSAFGFSVPEGYGSPDHRVSGLYAPAGGATGLRAVVTLDAEGAVKRVVARSERRWRPGPRELAPRRGDRFAPFVQVLTPPTAEGDWGVATAISNMLTFWEQPLRVVAGAPLPGDYLVGLVVEDLDGGLTRKYVPLAIGK